MRFHRWCAGIGVLVWVVGTGVASAQETESSGAEERRGDIPKTRPDATELAERIGRLERRIAELEGGRSDERRPTSSPRTGAAPTSPAAQGEGKNGEDSAGGQGEDGAPGPLEDDEPLISNDDWAAFEGGEEDDRGSTDADGPASPPSATAGEGQNAFGLNLNAFNPRITLFGDFVARRGTKVLSPRDDNRFSLREVEADFRAAVDPYADAVVILSKPEEEPLEVEEGYVTLNRLPFALDETLRLTTKIGKFRTAIGRTNRLHQHDLPRISPPAAMREIFGDEGALAGQGVSLSSLFGIGETALTATVEGINGEGARDEATGVPILLAGRGADQPAWVGRLSAFHDLTETMNFELGVGELWGPNSAAGNRDVQLATADATLLWKPSNERSFVLQAEWFRLDRPERAALPGEGDTRWRGGFLWSQVQFTRELFLGVGYDPAQDLSVRDEWMSGFSVWASYYTSEFLRLRLGYEHVSRARVSGRDTDGVSLQMTFVFGSHPAEPYYVNR